MLMSGREHVHIPAQNRKFTGNIIIVLVFMGYHILRVKHNLNFVIDYLAWRNLPGIAYPCLLMC